MVELTPSQIEWIIRGIRLGRLMRRWLDMAGAAFHQRQHRAKAETAAAHGAPSPEAGVIAAIAREPEKKRLDEASGGGYDGPVSNGPGVHRTRGDKAIEAVRSIHF